MVKTHTIEASRVERGAAMVEYALLLALIALAAILGLRMLGGTVDESFERVDSSFVDQTPAAP